MLACLPLALYSYQAPAASVHPCGGHLEYLRPEELVGNNLLVLEGTSGLCEIVDVTFEVYALHGL